MKNKMRLSTRKELVTHICEHYRQVSRQEKKIILDELMSVTGYKRKYAISLLNQQEIISPQVKKTRSPKYGETVREALITLWHAANQISFVKPESCYCRSITRPHKSVGVTRCHVFSESQAREGVSRPSAS